MRPEFAVSLFLLAAFLLLNVMAYRHARAMTHFAPGGVPVPGPQDLPALAGADPRQPAATARETREEARPAAPDLARDVCRFPGEAGDLEAWYVPHPRARGVVLMFHGYMASKEALLPEARALHG